MVEPPLQFIIFADVINSCNACLCTIFNNVEPFCSKRLQENVVSDRNWMIATLCMAGINLLFSVIDDISCSLFAPSRHKNNSGLFRRQCACDHFHVWHQALPTGPRRSLMASNLLLVGQSPQICTVRDGVT